MPTIISPDAAAETAAHAGRRVFLAGMTIFTLA